MEWWAALVPALQLNLAVAVYQQDSGQQCHFDSDTIERRPYLTLVELGRAQNSSHLHYYSGDRSCSPLDLELGHSQIQAPNQCLRRWYRHDSRPQTAGTLVAWN